MSGTAHLVLTGRAVVVGKEPDGDSVRFAPDDPALLRLLDHGDRARVSADGSVQLRFDGVDAPELHYQDAAQPLGGAARDRLLERLGFTGVEVAADGTTITAASPAQVRIAVLAQLVEINGRPVAVVFAGEPADALAPSAGRWIELTPALLASSVNTWAASTGTAYPMLYTSTDAALRDAFRQSARAARAARLGVWARDSSASFSVADASAIGPDGALVWPKLFRRAADFIRLRHPGDTLPAWLAATPLQDDDVLVGPDQDAIPVPLHTLLEQDGERVVFSADPVDLTVVER